MEHRASQFVGPNILLLLLLLGFEIVLCTINF
jgi:hypothetical protein